MPLRTAVRELHRTARVYKDAVTLIDPRTGREYSTLRPGDAVGHGVVTRDAPGYGR